MKTPRNAQIAVLENADWRAFVIVLGLGEGLSIV
jgi:hypothetical protein